MKNLKDSENSLSLWIIEDLKKSGLNDETIASMGIEEIKNEIRGTSLVWKAEERLKAILGFSNFDNLPILDQTKAYAIPYPNGNFTRVKLEIPLGEAKYLSPKKAEGEAAVHLYYMEKDKCKIFDPRCDLIITEGEKKTAKLSQELKDMDIAPIGLAGVTMWNTIEWQDIQQDKRKIYIAFDSDAKVKKEVNLQARKLAAFLKKHGAKVFFLSWNEKEGKGIDDYLVNMEKKGQSDAISFLLETAEKSLKLEKKNARLSLQEVEQLYEDFLDQHQFARNMLDDEITIDGRPFDDFEEKKLFELAYATIPKVSLNRITCKIFSKADQNRFNPIEDFVDNLPEWDGIDRIKQLANCFILTPESKNDPMEAAFSTERKLEYYLAKAIKRWKTNEHGVCLTLASQKQGIGKSTFFRWLCPLDGFFAVKPCNPDSKDEKIALTKTMLWELEELGSITKRKDCEAIKSFISCESVTERKVYARKEMKKPAKTIFGATVNTNGGFFTDTENRRFVVIHLLSIDWKYEEIDKIQLFAQAKHALACGKAELTLEEKTTQKIENKDCRVESALEIKISERYEITYNEADVVPASEILNMLLENKIAVRGNDLANALIALGAERIAKTVRINGKACRAYRGIKRIDAPIQNDYNGDL
jgi:predicted P-loop ATPase